LRKRLFWKLYLTLLASLLIVALLTGVVWRATAERIWLRWQALRSQLVETMEATRDRPSAALAAAISRLAEDEEADISVYDRAHRLIASDGEPIALPLHENEWSERRRRHTIRVDLPDGGIVLARLNPSPPEPGLRILVFVLMVAGGVGLAAYPVTRRLTRRLEDLRSGAEAWGEGSLSTRVTESGSDEVAQVARSFNNAAARIEALMAAQKSLLANASHELRSPLARLRVAVEMGGENPTPAARDEIARNLVEIDALVEEILLASRLDHDGSTGDLRRVDLLGLAAEEAARVAAQVEGTPIEVDADATLLRRMIRNLLENAEKHGAPPIDVEVSRAAGMARLTVSDRGKGVPPGDRERLFDPFYRPAGRSEASGGWGLGLSLVRQIARRHRGTARCDERPGGGTIFTVELPLAES
jgi:signal transduction histidine kinase